MNTKKSSQSTPELSPELRVKCNKIRGLMAKEAAGGKIAYQVGVEVHAVRQDPKAYGKGSVVKLARELGCTPALLYSYADVVAAWPKEAAFVAMCETNNAKGLPLGFSHFIEIAKAPPNARPTFFETALKDSLSVRALKRAVDATREQRKPKPGTDLQTITGRLLASSQAALKKAMAESDQLARLKIDTSTSMPTAEALQTIIDAYKKLMVTEGIICMRVEALLANFGRAEPAGERPFGLLPPPGAQSASPSSAGQHVPNKAVST